MSRPGLLLLTSLALLSAGCGAPTEVDFGAPRTVSREQRPTTWDAPARDRLGLREMDAPSPQQSWTGTTPSGWEELPPQPKRFRELLWRVAGNQDAECYLSAGVRGGVMSNMTRWYTQQFGIAEVPALEALPVVEIAGRQGRLVELAGTFNQKPGMAMLLAFFVQGEQLTTLKFTGPEAVVKQNREAFLGVAKSLRLVSAGPSREAAPGNAAGGGQRWTGTTPGGWEELPPQPTRFRDAIWRPRGAEETECYLSAGVGGGVAMNMARWYTQQFGIEQVPSLEALPVVEIAGRPGRLVELAGVFNQKPGMAMLLAFFAKGEQLTTLKFTGPEAVVKQNREQFLELARSLRLASASPDKEAPPIQPGQAMPPGHPAPGDPGNAPGAAPAASPFTATVPSGWAVKVGSQRALHYTFGSEGEVYMSQLGGTLRPTLDIWRGELELPAMSDTEFQGLTKVPMLGGEGTLLDAAGNYRSMSGKQIAGARVLIGALVEGSTITFVKLVGKAGEVETQRESLLQFLASLRRVP